MKKNISDTEMLEKLCKFNTPTVSNVVATYPKKKNFYCLGIYNQWKDRWYTDQSVRGIFPEKGSRAGYAFTMVVTVPGLKNSCPRISREEYVEALYNAKKPTIVVCQQLYPKNILDKAGLFGGQTNSLFKACGVVGVVTNGPSRDLDEIALLDIQYVLSGITPAHGDFIIKEVNVPVTVASMNVLPGEIIHMDMHGAIKFPSNRLIDVYSNIDKYSEEEEEKAAALINSKSLEELKKIW